MKAKFFALLAVVLAVVSCQRDADDLNVAMGGEQEVMLTVSLPEATRADSAQGFDVANIASTDYTLRYILEIYRTENVNGVDEVQYNTCQRFVEPSDNSSMVFPVRLAPGRDYRVVAWADIVEQNAADPKADRCYKTTDGLDAVEIIDEMWKPMDETRDAYTGLQIIKKFGEGQSTNYNITLQRPFAKIRVVATDIADIRKVGLEPTTATMSYTENMYRTFNAVAVADTENNETDRSNAAERKDVTYTYVQEYYEAYSKDAAEFTLFTDYIFVPALRTAKFTLTVKDQDDRTIKENSFNTEIFVERNKLTTIKGDVLTTGGNINVTVDNELGVKETYNIVDTAEDLVEQFEKLETADNVNIELGGDIDLSDLINAGILSTRANTYTYALEIPANKTVVLDLKEHNLVYSTDVLNRAMIHNYGNLTIKSTTGAVKFYYTGENDTTYGAGNYAINNGGILTINGNVEAIAGTVGEKFAHAFYAINTSGTLTIDGGKVVNNTNIAIRQWIGSETNASEITINGGEVEGSRAIWVQLPNNRTDFAPKGKINVNGGTLTGTAIDGTQDSGSVLAIYSYSYGNQMKNVEFDITNGTFYGDIALTGGRTDNKVDMEKVTISGGAFYGVNGDIYTYASDDLAAEAITITGGSFSTLSPIVYLADNCTYTLNSNVENAEPVKFVGNGTLNLNGKTVSAYDDATAGYALITNNGTLNITGEGTLKITGAANDRGWGAYSSVISNSTNGILTVGENVTIEHLGGTSMAYGIDVLTNGSIGDSHATVYGTVKSTYRAIRQFLNSDSKMNTLIVKEGAVINSTGGNKAIWMQDPSKKANNGTLVVESGAQVHSVYLDVTEGSTEWPVSVSVAASSLTDQSENKGLYTENIPDGYAVVNENGVWKVSYTCAAKIGNEEYTSLQAAIEAVEDGETIVIQRDIDIATPAYGQNALNHAKAVNFTLDLNGKTISGDTGNSIFRYNIANTNATSNVTITLKNGTVTSGDNTWCTVMATGLSADVKAIFNLKDLTINASKAGDFAVKAWQYAVINAENVTVNATKCAGGFYAVGGEIVLDNCTVNQKGLHTSPYMSMAIAVSTKGKLTVNSGNYSTEPTATAEGYNQGTSHGSWCAGVMNSGGELIINGGTYANGNFGDDALATAARGLIFGDTASKIVINDGTFNALKTVIDYQNNLGVQPNPNIVINGGNFSANPAIVTSYGGVVLAEGKVAAQGADGRWTLVDGVVDEAGLKAAFEQGGNIVLGADITVAEPVVLPEGKTATLDLNGKTLAADDEANKYAINNHGTLTIKGNGTVNARGMYNGYDANGNYVTTAKLTIENGTFNAKGTNGGACVFNYGNVDINGGTFTSIGGYSLNNQASGSMNIYSATVTGGIYNIGVSLVVNDGNIQTVRAGYTHAIYHNGTSLVINGGTFMGNGNEVVNANSAVATINGGTFTKDPNGQTSYLMAGANMTINNGTFNAHASNPAGHPVRPDVIVKGGTFNYKHSNIAAGYKIVDNGNGTWTVVAE